jgi:pheromone shutdown-related protein TraB
MRRRARPRPPLWPGPCICATVPRLAYAAVREVAIDEENVEGVEEPQEVVRLQVDGREILLIGTAHVSKESSELVRRVIEEERPDAVCVELDQRRYEALSQRRQWQELDLRQLIRRRQLTTLLVNLLLASYQRKIGMKLGVPPGTELLEAARAAEEHDIPLALCDRDVRTTLLRAWRTMSLWQRAKLFAALVAGMFDDAEITEEDLRRLRSKDLLSELLQELSRVMPQLKKVLIDERDQYLAERIRATAGAKVVAVVGAGQREGIVALLESGTSTPLAPLDEVPNPTAVWKWVGWAIPVVILGALGLIAWTQGSDVAGQNLMFWILANGIPSSIGAALALAHPVTVLTAFLAAPVTSLTPVIGAGYVTAFVQAWVQPPLVRDFEQVTQDASTLRMWWRNRLLRVLLAFILPTLGSVIGTYVGGYEILSNLF